MIAAVLVIAALLLLRWWLHRDPPSTVPSLREDADLRERKATSRYAASAADKQRLEDAPSATDDGGYYSVRHAGDGMVAFLEDDVQLYPGVCALNGQKTALELNLVTDDQGEGGYYTPLSGGLENRDGFAVSFPTTVPTNFEFGVGYMDSDPVYSDRIHPLAAYNGGRHEWPCVRIGPPVSGDHPGVRPGLERLYGEWQVRPSQKLGILIDGGRVTLFLAEDRRVLAVESIRVARDPRRPAQAYFRCYIEEPVEFSIQVENPALSNKVQNR